MTGPEVPSPRLDLQRLLDRPTDPAELEAAARAAAVPAERGARTRLGVLIFRIGEESLALPASCLRRVTTHAATVAVPHRSGKLLRGVCNVRGECVLCMDMASLLGLPAPSPDRAGRDDPRRIIVIGPVDAPWAFEADELHGVERVDPDAVLKFTTHLAPKLRDHAVGCFEHEGKASTLLDAERIMRAFDGGIA
jgi:chemotaxis-related protein WspD